MVGKELKICGHCCHAQWTKELTSTQSLNFAYNIITPMVVGVYRDWPGSSALNLYI